MSLTALYAADFWESLHGQWPAQKQAELSASQNDYDLDLAGGETAFDRTRFDLRASAAINITGIVAPAAGQTIVLRNVGENTITLKHQSGSSSAANRIITTDAGDLALAAGAWVPLVYDGTAQRWVAAASRPKSGFRMDVGSTATAWVVLLLGNVSWTLKHLSIDAAGAAQSDTVWYRKGVLVPGTSHAVDTAQRQASFPIFDGEFVALNQDRELIGASFLAAANDITVTVEPTTRERNRAI
ncbi:MAG: hypothetical protein M5U26_03560 [Planctomycetota bacterium]|nr:hypothetical protein [Planctomycetota bacterium]